MPGLTTLPHVPEDLVSWCGNLGAILYNARSPVVFITGTLSAQHYINEALQPVDLPVLNAHVCELFQQDNACPYTEELALQTQMLCHGQPHHPTYHQLKMCGMLVDTR